MKDTLELVGIITIVAIVAYIFGHIVFIGFSKELCSIKIDGSYGEKIAYQDGSPVEFLTKCKK